MATMETSTTNNVTYCCCSCDFFSFGLEVSYFKNYLAGKKACDSSPCLNGGNCSGAGEGNYTCQCSYGWAGKRCDGKGDLITFVIKAL